MAETQEKSKTHKHAHVRNPLQAKRQDTGQARGMGGSAVGRNGLPALEHRPEPHRHDRRKQPRLLCQLQERRLRGTGRDSQLLPGQCRKILQGGPAAGRLPKPVVVDRIGVRRRFLTPFDGPFEELVAKFTKSYVRLTDDAIEAIGGKLIDIGAPINFADKHGNFNTQAGIVAKEQGKQLLENRDDVPAVGFYYDIDYWLQKPGEMKDGNILQTIKNFAVEGSARHDRVRKLIMGI